MTSTETEASKKGTPQGKERGHHFMVATDGSPAAIRAGDFAARLAADSGARLTIVAVAVEHGTPILPWDFEPTEHAVPANEAAEWTRALTRQLQAEEVEVTEVLLQGHAADALINEAKDRGVDLIVVGHHGRSESPGQSPGSVMQALARSAPCPILIVP